MSPGDVLITTVGPFERFGYPVAEAAALAGAHYIDSTGEVGFVRELQGRLDGIARANGSIMLPAFGYDYVPGVLAGTLATRGTRVDEPMRRHARAVLRSYIHDAGRP